MCIQFNEVPVPAVEVGCGGVGDAHAPYTQDGSA